MPAKKKAKKLPPMELYRPFIVCTREVHSQPYRVNARNAEEALQLVADGDGEMIEGDMSYSHTLDKDKWDVTEEQEPKKGRK